MINKEKSGGRSYFIRAEVNFERLPVFSPWDKRKAEIYTYRKKVRRDNQIITIEWQVIPATGYGRPAAFDRDVYTAIQILAHKNNFSDYIPFSLCEIEKIMHMKHSGPNIKKIKESIERLTLTGFKSKGSFYYKAGKFWINEIFHLFDSVIWSGEILQDGTIARNNYIKLGEWVKKSLDSKYYRPIDSNFYFNLKNSTARTLYKYLSSRFGSAEHIRQMKFFQKNYSDLCKETMITYQKFYSKAVQILRPAINELIAAGFLKDVLFSKNGANEIVIKFFPGIRLISTQINFLDSRPEDNSNEPRLTEPEGLIKAFYEKLFKSDGISKKPSKKEVNLVSQNFSGKESFLMFTDFVVREAIEKQRFPGLKNLCGAFTIYYDEFLDKKKQMKEVKLVEDNLDSLIEKAKTSKFIQVKDKKLKIIKVKSDGWIEIEDDQSLRRMISPKVALTCNFK